MRAGGLRLVRPQGALDEREARAFLSALLAEATALWESTHDANAFPLPRAFSPLGDLAMARQYGDCPAAEVSRWWGGFEDRVLSLHPQAHGLALEWLCRTVPREGIVAPLCHARKSWGVRASVNELLTQWVLRHPVPGAVERLLRAARELVGTRAPPVPFDPVRQAKVLIATATSIAGDPAREGLLSWPEVRSLARGIAEEVLALEVRESAVPGYSKTRTDYYAREDAAGAAMRLLEVDAGDGGLLGQVLLTYPCLARPLGSPGRTCPPAMAERLRRGTRAMVDRLLREELDTPHGDRTGTPGSATWKARILVDYGGYRGLDDFTAACLCLSLHPRAKLPPLPYWRQSGAPATLAWALALLVHLPAPSPDDVARTPELVRLSPASLLTAALLAPAWAPLVEAVLEWPGLAGASAWLKRYGGQYRQPWSGWNPILHGEEDTRWSVDRSAAGQAAGLMDRNQLGKLLTHEVTRKFRREGAYYLEAVLGLNAGEVADGFGKRDKCAVRALGMLPAGGAVTDVVERYLALRRFAVESKRHGAKRQASEGRAFKSGLANLAVTAGYTSVTAFEWAMETLVSGAVDPSTLAWSVAGYDVRVEPDAKATLVITRAGRRLLGVPQGLRRTPQYAAIKAAREVLSSQWQRVVRRLEAGMATGEVFERGELAAVLATPAGRTVLPKLVLRRWTEGCEEPVELLDSRTLDGQPLPAEIAGRTQVAHPIHLARSGSLEAWRRRLVSFGFVQPFNQLFRECHAPSEKELEGEVSRFVGRRAMVGRVTDWLRRRGWELDSDAGLERLLADGRTAGFWFSDGPPYARATSVLTVGPLFLPRGFGELAFSEVVREVDLATAGGPPEAEPRPGRRKHPASPVAPAPQAVSAETVEVRKALALVLIPGVEVEGELARAGPYGVDLRTGDAFGPDGRPMIAPRRPIPAGFPYANPDRTTATVMARLARLSRVPGLRAPALVWRRLKDRPCRTVRGRSALPSPK